MEVAGKVVGSSRVAEWVVGCSNSGLVLLLVLPEGAHDLIRF